MQASDWPAPSAPQRPETRRERMLRVAPATLIALGLHGLMAWSLMRASAPWPRVPTASGQNSAIEVEFLTPPPSPPPRDSAQARADTVPFPTTRPTMTEAITEVREPTAVVAPDAAPTVDASVLFGDIAGVAADRSRPNPAKTSRSNTRLPGRTEAFITSDIVFKPPPPSLQQLVNAIGGMVVRTNAANSTTGLMGSIPGRDPGREIQAAHHDGLYLPRGCDDPDDPNLSDECMGVPKR